MLLVNLMSNKYEKQIEFEKDFMKELPLRYTMPESIDNWRHARMLDTIIEIINYSKENKKNLTNSWVTIGDGRFADNAHYLQEK